MTIDIRQAIAAEAGAVTDCVCQAFIRYSAEIGKHPQPMLDDYNALIAEGRVYVALKDNRLVGVLVISTDAEGFCIETLAAHPQLQGQGVGKALIAYAENLARLRKAASLYLSTHVVMWQSQDIYRHLGFVEFDRRVVNGYHRIFMRKSVAM